MRDSSLARLKMKQYLASALLCAVLGAALLLTGRLWSGAAAAGQTAGTTGGEPANQLLYKGVPVDLPVLAGPIVCFGGVDLIQGLVWLAAWKRLADPAGDGSEAGTLFTDWPDGKRSPFKITLALLACWFFLIGLFLLTEHQRN